MRIRRAALADMPRMVEIEEQCFPEEAAFPPGMFAYLIKYAVTLVACDPPEQIVGFIAGYVSGRVGAIYTLDVHPLFRKRGTGSELIRALESELQSLGARAIRLEAAVANQEARGLYIRAGYQESELLRNYYGRQKHALRMWKLLEPGESHGPA
ncbi:MAG: GNAT family N-acetyltransferase [Methanotrichaceae archaeon]|nr:GNAT family N-acetyltransferase [Methanotrichaceae archaeon]